MVAVPARILMSAEKYLIWEPTQEQRYEYWDGEVVAMSGGTRSHNRVCGNFFRVLDDALLDRIFEVYIVDVKVQVESKQKYFYPDVVVTCDERDSFACAKGDRNPQLIQFPCLIVEVLSPSTEAADRGKKFAKYRQSSTLKEYILVQVAQPGVEVFRRNEQGKWVLSEYNLDELLPLESVNVEIAIADLYRQVQFETEETED
ncbi:Uma2 family endonuclease [Scytonema sp. UIC 10036]|uniref:Uma2 family endonuclease n=1 Tax=Scytonema sp. UIC 10036 TaxID=2304196 RepID=UPI0012DABFCA|nr:Uma2 family endonuclease [Scytonema sp. UIC 10036]MUG98682.1 Uma2 family endonuclease [Scytonema sp. UIC 10036]